MEERLRALALRGDITHLSVAFHGDKWHARVALSKDAGGYRSAEGTDIIGAMDSVLAAAGRVKAVTAPVTEPEVSNIRNEEPSPLGDWTTP